MLKISILSVLILVSSTITANADLKYDARTYDTIYGCYDPLLRMHRRIKLTKADEINSRLKSKDFECTEFSDLIIGSRSEGVAYLAEGDFSGFKVLNLEGTDGPLGSAGIFDFNFRGAKIDNLFLDYQVAIGGNVDGLKTHGIYLAFYAKFISSPDFNVCKQLPYSEQTLELPVYAVRTQTGAAISLKPSFSENFEFRNFDTGIVHCNGDKFLANGAKIQRLP